MGKFYYNQIAKTAFTVEILTVADTLYPQITLLLSENVIVPWTQVPLKKEVH